MSKRSLTDDEVIGICELLMDGEKIKDIAELYDSSIQTISQIKYKKMYRHITQLYNLEEIWKPKPLPSKYSDEFIDFIFECIKNNTSINEILLDERCDIQDKHRLSAYISNIRNGRLYRNRLIKNRMYTDDINDPINNITDDETIISIANDIKTNPLVSNKELAKKYNLNVNIISDIRNGRYHSDVTAIDNKQYLLSHINNQLVLQIANDIKTNPLVSNKELAKKYNLNVNIISDIRNGKRHSKITGIKKGQYKLYKNNKENE